MRRRAFVSGTAATTLALAGCLGDADLPGTDSTPQTDDEHVSALRTEIADRGVDLESVELEADVVAVEHGYDDDPNDAIANVSMAFVERIGDEWDVDRLEGHLRDQGNDWAWHAEAEWAREYVDGDIGPEEYGNRISETMSMKLDEEA
jgi:hypothetical protein